MSFALEEGTKVLLEADGGVVSAEELLERVWDEHADPFTNAVPMTLARLRAKLGPPPVIETVIGSGFPARVIALAPKH